MLDIALYLILFPAIKVLEIKKICNELGTIIEERVCIPTICNTWRRVPVCPAPSPKRRFLQGSPIGHTSYETKKSLNLRCRQPICKHGTMDIKNTSLRSNILDNLGSKSGSASSLGLNAAFNRCMRSRSSRTSNR